VGSMVVEIEYMYNLILQSIGELDEELKKDVLLRMPTYESNKVDILRTKFGKKMEDNLQDYRVGHCFVSNRNNHCSDYITDLICHIVHDATLWA